MPQATPGMVDEYEAWLAVQDQKLQRELANVPKQHIVWQVDGNIFGDNPLPPRTDKNWKTSC